MGKNIHKCCDDLIELLFLLCNLIKHDFQRPLALLLPEKVSNPFTPVKVVVHLNLQNNTSQGYSSYTHFVSLS